ncbi:hypothetical protein OG21DRAFT_1524909 [Imleria badia]|nr:hypothetical protein OG21DRAFT_1524909 [Imleria badia]
MIGGSKDNMRLNRVGMTQRISSLTSRAKDDGSARRRQVHWPLALIRGMPLSKESRVRNERFGRVGALFAVTKALEFPGSHIARPGDEVPLDEVEWDNRMAKVGSTSKKKMVKSMEVRLRQALYAADTLEEDFKIDSCILGLGKDVGVERPVMKAMEIHTTPRLALAVITKNVAPIRPSPGESLIFCMKRTDLCKLQSNDSSRQDKKVWHPTH